MHAFEQIVAEIMERDGYWVRASVKVELSQQVKQQLGNPYMPRPEIDIVAYKPQDNRLLVIECKSFFDSLGVAAADVMGSVKGKDRYKLFTNTGLRQAIENALKHDWAASGMCLPNPTVEYWLICGNIKNGDKPVLQNHFQNMGWQLRDKEWLATELKKAAIGKYENLVSTMVAKILS